MNININISIRALLLSLAYLYLQVSMFRHAVGSAMNTLGKEAYVEQESLHYSVIL